MKNKIEYSPLIEESEIDLIKVSPSRALLFYSMPCEQQTAYITNEAINGIKKNDLSCVAYRYFQSKKGEKESFNASTAFGAALIISITFFLKTKRENNAKNNTVNLLVMILSFMNLLPNLWNTVNYRKTKNMTKDWLCSRLGHALIDQFEKISYSRHGLFQAKQLLDKKENVTIALDK